MDETNQKVADIINDESIVDIAKKRQEEIEHKRLRFNRIMKIVKIFLVVFIIVCGIGLFFLRKEEQITPPKFNVEEQTTNQPEETTWRLYKSDVLKVFIQNESNTYVRETKSPTFKVEVIYDSIVKDLTKITDANLQQGYIFRVTPLNVGLRTLESITQIKQDSFKLKCPPTATFSQIQDKAVDDVRGKSFEIMNCDSDYIVTYVPKYDIYYEIIQMFKGDFGYRQKYKALTEQMLTTFKFFPDVTEPIGPFQTYINEGTRILFIHPNLDPDCCKTPEPPIDSLEKIVVLGDTTTYIDANNFDGIGFYRVNSQNRESFEQFVEGQRKILKEDYKVVRGTEPVTEDKRTKVGKYDAIMLKGYSWRGNNLIYSMYTEPEDQRTYFLIISTKNVSGEEFDKKVSEILNSFEVF